MPNDAIPDPELVRIWLAKSARETRRLKELLVVSERAAKDRQFIKELTPEPRPGTAA